MEDLNTLITNFPNPKYYINIANPRSLPETRFNTVWCDSNKLKGLASYYLELNPNDPKQGRNIKHICYGNSGTVPIRVWICL